MFKRYTQNHINSSKKFLALMVNEKIAPIQ